MATTLTNLDFSTPNLGGSDKRTFTSGSFAGPWQYFQNLASGSPSTIGVARNGGVFTTAGYSNPPSTANVLYGTGVVIQPFTVDVSKNYELVFLATQTPGTDNKTLSQACTGIMDGTGRLLPFLLPMSFLQVNPGGFGLSQDNVANAYAPYSGGIYTLTTGVTYTLVVDIIAAMLANIQIA